MACFLVSAAEAVVVTVVEKVEEKKELKAVESSQEIKTKSAIPMSRKLKYLIVKPEKSCAARKP